MGEELPKERPVRPKICMVCGEPKYEKCTNYLCKKHLLEYVYAKYREKYRGRYRQRRRLYCLVYYYRNKDKLRKYRNELKRRHYARNKRIYNDYQEFQRKINENFLKGIKPSFEDMRRLELLKAAHARYKYGKTRKGIQRKADARLGVFRRLT